MRRTADLSGETLSGVSVNFTYDAYTDAMQRYSLKDIEEVVAQLEDAAREKSGVTRFLETFGIPRPRVDGVPEEVANFFRDFAIIQETDHPDYDRGVAIGSLATRIELALGQVPAEKLTPEFYTGLTDARREYDLIFG